MSLEKKPDLHSRNTAQAQTAIFRQASNVKASSASSVMGKDCRHEQTSFQLPIATNQERESLGSGVETFMKKSASPGESESGTPSSGSRPSDPPSEPVSTKPLSLRTESGPWLASVCCKAKLCSAASPNPSVKIVSTKIVFGSQRTSVVQKGLCSEVGTSWQHCALLTDLTPGLADIELKQDFFAHYLSENTHLGHVLVS